MTGSAEAARALADAACEDARRLAQIDDDINEECTGEYTTADLIFVRGLLDSAHARIAELERELVLSQQSVGDFQRACERAQAERDAWKKEARRYSERGDALQDQLAREALTLSDDQTIALAVAEYKSAAAAVEATHQTKVIALNAVIDSYKAELASLRQTARDAAEEIAEAQQRNRRAT